MRINHQRMEIKLSTTRSTSSWLANFPFFSPRMPWDWSTQPSSKAFVTPWLFLLTSKTHWQAFRENFEIFCETVIQRTVESDIGHRTVNWQWSRQGCIIKPPEGSKFVTQLETERKLPFLCVTRCLTTATLHFLILNTSSNGCPPKSLQPRFEI